MNFKEKKQKLYDLYTSFERTAAPYLHLAVCKMGCADCCTTVGNIDASTLEGMCILEYMKSFTPAQQKDIHKKLKRIRKLKENSTYVSCAFLSEDKTCSVYPVRPFSCRRLYSIERCGENGPAVHRQVWQLAGEIEKAIRLLDDNGYCGHLSYILQLLKDSKFRNFYMNDGFSPDRIRRFALNSNLSINRFVP